MMSKTDIDWMRECIAAAEQAEREDEVPVGALIVSDGRVISRAWNQPIGRKDPCAHAEILALREAAQHIGNYRLLNTTLYVTLEPCVMCVGAMIHARIQRLVFGAFDAKAGAVSSVFQILDEKKLNHRIAWEGGVLQSECGHLLSNFFQQKRQKTV